jgi:hypothetical protein
MDNRIKVNFQNIKTATNSTSKVSSTKSKSIEKPKKTVQITKPVVTNSKKSPEPKSKANIQPFAHLYQNGPSDFQKSVNGLNDLIMDYSNLEN